MIVYCDGNGYSIENGQKGCQKTGGLFFAVVLQMVQLVVWIRAGCGCGCRMLLKNWADDGGDGVW